MEIKRGDVYYVTNLRDLQEAGSEQHSGRPAIIVSNDKNNEFSPVVEVVYLTTRPKTRLPTHIDIRATGKPSIAICEQITSVAVERLGDFVGALSDLELEMLNAALEISLDLHPGAEEEKTTRKEPPAPVEKAAAAPEGMSAETAVLKADRDLYKGLYEKLLDKLTS